MPREREHPITLEDMDDMSVMFPTAGFLAPSATKLAAANMAYDHSNPREPVLSGAKYYFVDDSSSMQPTPVPVQRRPSALPPPTRDDHEHDDDDPFLEYNRHNHQETKRPTMFH